MKKKRLFFLRATVLLVLALVLTLDAAFLLTKDRAFSPTENRSLQQRPTLTLASALSGRYEARYDDYISDQFPFRDGWVALKSAMDRLAGRTESGGVFLGRDGSLIQDFAEPTGDNYVQTLAALRSFLTRHGALAQYVMIVPTALTARADALPAFAVHGDESGYLDRLARDLADTPAQWIDLRPAFAASEAQLYYRTDHHWTTDGAYIAYLELSKAANLSGAATAYERHLLSNDFSGTLTAASGFRTGQRDDLYAYLPPDDGVQTVVTYVGENARSASLYRAKHLDTRDQYAVFLDGNHPEIKIETTVDNGRTLLVLKDSYANCFIPFLTRDYGKIIVVDPRYFTGDLEVLMAAEGINETLILYNATTLAADQALRLDIGE